MAYIVRGEIEHVPLNTTHVFDDLPGRIWHSLWSDGFSFDRKSIHDVLESCVRIAAE
jgi:hypothetical protein